MWARPVAVQTSPQKCYHTSFSAWTKLLTETVTWILWSMCICWCSSFLAFYSLGNTSELLMLKIAELMWTKRKAAKGLHWARRMRLAVLLLQWNLYCQQKKWKAIPGSRAPGLPKQRKSPLLVFWLSHHVHRWLVGRHGCPSGIGQSVLQHQLQWCQ